MLITELKPLEQILQYMDGENRVFLVGCHGCAEGCQTGGEPQVLEMKQRLEAAGKAVAGYSVIDMVCNDSAAGLRLMAHQDAIASADSLLVLCCGAGVQATAGIVDRTVHPACNTVSLGGGHAEWKNGERCMECGDCVLDYTGGICPIARCAKHLLNGPCGGSQGGHCEVSPELPCAWQLINDRLVKLGQLDKLLNIVAPKNWSVSLVGGPPAIR